MYLLLLINLLAISPEPSELEAIREGYYQAINNSKAADRLHLKLKKIPLPKPLVLAYLGSTQALKARFSWNPYNKLNYLSQGLKTLNTAVSKSPDGLEIRFLRFSLVHYLPSFLGYSETLNPDKKKIVELVRQKRYGTVDHKLLKNMISFMKETKRCDSSEIKVLDRALTNG